MTTTRINVGELHQRHVPLFTREAAAVLHEVASRLADWEEEGRPVAPPSIDQLWVTDAGALVVDQVLTSVSNVGREQTMQALASMIEALLPSVRNRREYAVPGSFRILAPRARGWPPGLPAIATPRDLAAAISRYRSGDTESVLRSLYERVTPTPAEAKAEAATADLDLPLRTPPADIWVRPVASRTSRANWSTWLLGAVATVLAFAVGYQAARHLTPRPENAGPPHEHVSAAAQPPVAETESAIHDAGVVDSKPARPAPRASAVANVPNATIPESTARSRASSTLVAKAHDNIETADAVDTAPAPLELARSGPVFSPSFAATGSSLMFHAGREPVAQLMTADLDGSSAPLEVVTVVGGSARNYHPRLSPDGRYLAFDSDRDGERGVYVADRDGTNLQRVSGEGFAAVPSWSPDMRALAFVRAERDRPQVWNLWRLDRTTGRQTRLTNHGYGQTWGASWFPDSRRVCYSHEDRIVVLDTETGQTRTYVSPLPRRLLRTPAVSPDGRLVAFQMIRNGVWLLNVGDGAMRRLIEDPSAEEFAWSPDGRRLAYHSRRSGEWRIWIAAAPADVGTPE